MVGRRRLHRPTRGGRAAPGGVAWQGSVFRGLESRGRTDGPPLGRDHLHGLAEGRGRGPLRLPMRRNPSAPFLGRGQAPVRGRRPGLPIRRAPPRRCRRRLEQAFSAVGPGKSRGHGRSGCRGGLDGLASLGKPPPHPAAFRPDGWDTGEHRRFGGHPPRRGRIRRWAGRDSRSPGRRRARKRSEFHHGLPPRDAGRGRVAARAPLERHLPSPGVDAHQEGALGEIPVRWPGGSVRADILASRRMGSGLGRARPFGFELPVGPSIRRGPFPGRRRHDLASAIALEGRRRIVLGLADTGNPPERRQIPSMGGMRVVERRRSPPFARDGLDRSFLAP